MGESRIPLVIIYLAKFIIHLLFQAGILALVHLLVMLLLHGIRLFSIVMQMRWY